MCDYCGQDDGLPCCEVCQTVWFTNCAKCGRVIEYLDSYIYYDQNVCKGCF